MANWHNPSGSPLSDISWLERHHAAKRPERIKFIEQILALKPKSIVDLGCGPGLWLEEIANTANTHLRLIGMDKDQKSLDSARHRLNNTPHDVSLYCFDLENDLNQIPNADIYLAFNIFPYLRNASDFLGAFHSLIPAGATLIVRQYDGGLLRFGPMAPQVRAHLDFALNVAVGDSRQFNHFAMDSVFSALKNGPFLYKRLEFEAFSRTSPYTAEFSEYLQATVEWSLDFAPENICEELKNWRGFSNNDNGFLPSYFVSIDLVGWLS
jgi:SAM-dependent methyltransferase